MSATIADDSEIIKTFSADKKSIINPLKSHSLAGVSERMILMPGLMNSDFSIDDIKNIIKWTVKMKHGVLILVSSYENTKIYTDVGIIPDNSQAVGIAIENLQSEKCLDPLVLANRYDGIDLPNNACRLLIFNGLPIGTSNYELYRGSALYGGKSILRMMAQRIEQGIGRGARGAGDYCVVILLGDDISSWISNEQNFSYLTTPTKAQLEMGFSISEEIHNIKELKDIINRSFIREKEWVEYHAETLAENVHEIAINNEAYRQSDVERKVFNLWIDGYYEKAIVALEKYFNNGDTYLDKQNKGWLLQLAARISHFHGNKDKYEIFQNMAFAENRNLYRLKVNYQYQPLITAGEQAKVIIEKINSYKFKRGLLIFFEEIVSKLIPHSSSNQFEQSLCDLAKIIGFASERHDDNGVGPDVLWIAPNKIGFIIEAKNRKKEDTPLTKKEHGQLLVAKEWFNKNYSDYNCIVVSIHPNKFATEAASADNTYVLTYKKLSELIINIRKMLNSLCESNIYGDNLVIKCEQKLIELNIHISSFVETYLEQFKVEVRGDKQ